ncbi:hypothetical protein [Blastococcus xanthinilyticus]|uniref:hypothetical protein n=1 Tax=Blastococcus xanthinilyticus TaxID=1564164 RepID=UPI001412F879|nr:hypothetical protein [Blastococcus xanthinilyticus]
MAPPRSWSADAAAGARCGCCARDLPRSSVHELGATPGVFICRRCALWALARIGRR